jgi:TatD DNase family protein
LPVPFINIHSHHIPVDVHEMAIVNYSNDDSAKDLTKNEYWSAGLHPWFLDEEKDEINWDQVCKWAVSNKIIAIGECGLDKLRGPSIQVQEKVFIKHIELSIQTGLPLIIHCVKAYDLLLQIRKKFTKTPCWIVHGFKGKEDLANQLIEKDIKLSFGAALLEEQNLKLHMALKSIDLSHVFFETDDQRLNVSDIYQKASDIRCLKQEDLARQIQFNFEKCFRKS